MKAVGGSDGTRLGATDGVPKRLLGVGVVDGFVLGVGEREGFVEVTKTMVEIVGGGVHHCNLRRGSLNLAVIGAGMVVCTSKTIDSSSWNAVDPRDTATTIAIIARSCK